MNMQTTNLKDQLHDIYGMWHTPWWQTSWFYGVVAVLVIVLLALCAWFLIQRVRGRRALLTPHDQALAQLRVLAAMQPQECKLFYLELTKALKEYFEKRYHASVQGKTDNEVVAFLEQIDTASEVKKYFTEIAQGGVYVKFANDQVVKEKMEQDVSRAIEIVNITIPEVQ